MTKSLIFMYASFIYANILGYILHFVISRDFGPVGYGEFMVIFSFFQIVTKFGSSIGNAGLKFYIDDEDNKISILRFVRVAGLSAGLLAFVIIFLFSSAITSFLKISDSSYLIIVSIGLIFYILADVERTFMHSNKKFGFISLYSAIELSLRFVLTLIVLYLGYNIGGVLAASAVSAISIFLLSFNSNRSLIGLVKKIPLKNFGYVAVSSLPVGYFIYADDMFIRRVFDMETAGLYSSVSILGKAFTWILILSYYVFAPVLIKERGGVLFKKYFAKLVLLYIALGVIAVIFLKFVGLWFFTKLFGDKFVSAYPYLIPYIIATLPMALHVCVVNIFIAFEKHMLYIYSAIAVYSAGFLIVNHSVESYIVYYGITNTIFFMVDIFLLWLIRKKSVC